MNCDMQEPTKFRRRIAFDCYSLSQTVDHCSPIQTALHDA